MQNDLYVRHDIVQKYDVVQLSENSAHVIEYLDVANYDPVDQLHL